MPLCFPHLEAAVAQPCPRTAREKTKFLQAQHHRFYRDKVEMSEPADFRGREFAVGRAPQFMEPAPQTCGRHEQATGKGICEALAGAGTTVPVPPLIPPTGSAL